MRKINVLVKYVVFTGILFVLFTQFGVSLNAAVPTGERAALIAFYNAVGGDSWGDNSGWKTPPLDTDGFAMPGTENGWFGITVAGDHVTEIDFGILGNDLSGTLPAELGNLPYLETLYLLRDNLTGSIPPELGNLTRLRVLSLYMNQLTGTIPTELGNLINLEELSLGENQLTGSVPTELGNLSRLTSLFLCYNPMSGTIPPELGNLTNLEDLYLCSMGLTGTIPPELGNLTGLRVFGMSYNQLTGTIPPGLGNLVYLEEFYLSGNQLTGSIPSSFGNLVNLERLNLDRNQLSGTLPPELGNLGNLDSLHLEENQLSGSIPAEYGNLGNLRVFFIFSNKLSGDIPTALLSLTTLSGFVDIRYNALYTDNEALWSLLKGDYTDWRDSQTTAPSNISAAPVTASSITVSWTPIDFTTYTGGYKVYYSLTGGGPWTYSGMTTTKSNSSYTVTGLTPGTTYYFVVAAQTDPHTHNSNTVVSEYSEEVSAATNQGEGYTIALNRVALNFGCTGGGNAPASQYLSIDGSSSSLNWTASVDAAWLSVTPRTGTAPGFVTVSIDPSSLSAGTYTGIISVSDTNAYNSPLTVVVSLQVYEAGASSEPFGNFATPLNNSTVRSSVPVTGWVLDDIGVESVKIYRVENGGSIYIGDAVFVEGARPDIE
ncbi:MAG: hypothetical protein GY950_32535, partial [bacterium]|nr:hypothetical protein [bacterium]